MTTRKTDFLFWEFCVKPHVARTNADQSNDPSVHKFVLEGNGLDVSAEINDPDRLNQLQHAYLMIDNMQTSARLFQWSKQAGNWKKERLRADKPNPTLSPLKSIHHSAVYSFVMEVWRRAELLSSVDLVYLIRSRGNNNKISMSDPEWFDLEFVLKLLKKLEDKRDWPWAVLLLNNVINYEIADGRNGYLLKAKKTSYLDNSQQGTTPAVFRYQDERHPKNIFKPYEFSPKKEILASDEPESDDENAEPPKNQESRVNPLGVLINPPKKRAIRKSQDEEAEEGSGKKRETKISWFNVWMSSPYRCVVTGVQFKVYNIAQSITCTDTRIQTLQDYKPQKEINVFTGYKWTLSELQEAAESEHGKVTIAKYLNHVFNVICDGNSEQFQCLINTFSHFVQHPGVKTQYCVYVKGQKGVGKSLLLFTPFQLLFHQHSCYLAGELLADDFNGRLRDGVLLVNLDEFPQNIKNMQAFKSQITQGYMNVRPMFHEAETVPNLMNFIITSNFEPSRQMEISSDERRFLLIEAKKFDASQLKIHCAQMTDFAKTWLQDNGLNTGYKAICYHFLHGVPPPPENLHLHIPMTPLMCKIIEKQMPLMERAVKKWIEQGGICALNRTGNRKDYDWDNSDCAREWTWQDLREEALATLNEDRQYTARRNVNSDIESLKTLILTDEKKRQGNKRGSVTCFKINDRQTHYYHYRKYYPTIIFYWAHQSLSISDDPFTAAKKSLIKADPDFNKLVEETKSWSEYDFQLALLEAKRALKRKQIDLCLSADAPEQSAKFMAGLSSHEPKRARLYVSEKPGQLVEISSTNDEDEDGDGV